MTPRLLKILAWAALIELALAAVAEAAKRSEPRRANDQPAAVRYVYPAHRAGFTGGWYAENYHYFYARGPLVSYNDPYDYNGDYFPPTTRR